MRHLSSKSATHFRTSCISSTFFSLTHGNSGAAIAVSCTRTSHMTVNITTAATQDAATGLASGHTYMSDDVQLKLKVNNLNGWNALLSIQIYLPRALLSATPPSYCAARKKTSNSFAHVDVGDDAWLMQRMVLAQIHTAALEEDETFCRLVVPLLSVLEGHILLEDKGLKLILDRYARCAEPKLHPQLRDRAVSCWGNPWLESRREKWANVSPEARKLVIGWFKLKAIRTFFELLSEDRKTDPRRVRFWEQYYEQIDDMYFALGNAIRDSRNPDAKAMRREMGERLLGLRDAGSPANNAFIMKMGNLVAVEFGMTGHACFCTESALCRLG